MKSHLKMTIATLIGSAVFMSTNVSAHEVYDDANTQWSANKHGDHHSKDNQKELDLEVTYSPLDALDQDNVTESGELLINIIPDREIARLHAASKYQTVPLERHLLPPYYPLPAMDRPEDYVTTKDEFVNINPAPGEWVRIMEGKRHGFRSTTVGITYTQQGGGAPLHTHETEETHVLVAGGKVRYQLGNDVFEVEGPYVINIPPMVPHAFMNLRKKPMELVVFFPHNEWEADFVEHPGAAAFFTLPNR